MRLLIGIGLGALATVIVAAAVWLIVVYTGAYNVAASDAHADIVRWTFDTTMHRSVRQRAEDVAPPEDVGQEALEAGASTYASTCAHCHGAPGKERSSWATNMRPMPPELVEAAAHWEPRELFWIVKHGIKMSGMPAFGPEHDDEAIWGIVGFVAQLPSMTPEEYDAATAGASGHGGHGG